MNDFVKGTLGVGAASTVYLVHIKGYPEGTQNYAMKVFDNRKISNEKMLHVLEEKKILQITEHPLIITMYASYVEEFKTHFVMEYCPGGEFFRVLCGQEHRCLNEATARFYAAEVLAALEYLHKKGICHRDLKPENLLFHESGHIRLADFDLSKCLGKNLDEPRNKLGSLLNNIKKNFNEMFTSKSECDSAFITDDIVRKSRQLKSFVGVIDYNLISDLV
jgi:serine/threonine protein kinase